MTATTDDYVVELRNLSKLFGGVAAVESLDLQIRRGEFFALLGPSGCGKTTTLRMVAGFERPSAGTIFLDGQDITERPAFQRDVHTVFQSYALFPHMNVTDNIAFGLRRHRVSRRESRARAAEVLELVGLSGFETRRVSELSGGQQQRVALARAVVLRPAVLLLDEPLSALDAKIRAQLRLQLKALQEQLGTTFIFVTHDQEEALSMSDRIGVMNEGRLDQVGTPEEVYESPTTLFVADFLGISNLMHGEISSVDERGCQVQLAGFTLRSRRGEAREHGPAAVVARPERITIEQRNGSRPPNAIPGMVERSVYTGSTLSLMVRLATGALIQVSSMNTGSERLASGTAVYAVFPEADLHVLSAG